MILAWKLEDTIPSSEKAGRQASLSFVGHVVTWLPEEKKTACELVEHLFLDFIDR